MEGWGLVFVCFWYGWEEAEMVKIVSISGTPSGAAGSVVSRFYFGDIGKYKIF